MSRLPFRSRHVVRIVHAYSPHEPRSQPGPERRIIELPTISQEVTERFYNLLAVGRDIRRAQKSLTTAWSGIRRSSDLCR